MIKLWIRKHEIIAFFILAYGISWIIEIALILSRLGAIAHVPLWFHYFTAYGPLLAAFVVQGATGGWRGITSLLSTMVKWNVGLRWIIIGAISPIALFAASALAVFLISGQTLDFGLLGKINFLPNLGLWAWLFWIFNSGIGEETGWRGFALPRLQRNRSALSASLILGLLWACWHLPAFFYLPNYMKMGISFFPVFALGVFSGAILFTWLFNSAKGSVFVAILWHGAFNFVTASKAGEGVAAIITSNLIMAWAILIVLICKPRNLSLSGKLEEQNEP